MSNLAAAGNKLIVDSGRERRTDGLLKHLGLADVASFRVTGYDSPRSGRGTELIFYGPGGNGTLQAYDRDTSHYLDLTLNAKSIRLQPQEGGAIYLNGPTNATSLACGSQIVVTLNPPPINNGSYAQGQLVLQSTAGNNAPVSIGFHESGSSALTLYKPSGTDVGLRVRTNSGADYPLLGAPNSVQQVIGQYTAGNSFACTTGPWVESTVQFNATCTGGLMVRLEASVSFYNSVAGTINYLGFGMDGAAQCSFAITHCPVNGYLQTACGVFYMVPSAGVHRFSVMVGVNGGTMTFYNGANALFYATEQRA